MLCSDLVDMFSITLKLIDEVWAWCFLWLGDYIFEV